MNLMRIFGPILVACLLVCGCSKEANKQTKDSAMDNAPVRTDSLALSGKIRVPVAAQNIRWQELARGIGSSRIGPTDTKLHVSFRISDEGWAPLQAEFGEAMKRRDFTISADLAKVFFDASDLAKTKATEAGYAWDGEIYNPQPLAKIHYIGVLAIRLGETVYLEFVSN